MSKQPKALELARYLDLGIEAGLFMKGGVVDSTAALLRSQHELIGELVEALAQLECKANLGAQMSASEGVAGGFRVLGEFARSALSKAKEQQ